MDEFSTVAWVNVNTNAGGVKVEIQQCGVCFALVQQEYAQHHLNWHEEEGHLKP